VVFLGTVASESAIGSTVADTLVGNGGDDTLFGLQGNDNISGDAGNDVLVGDLGDDLLLGGDGADRILGGDGADRIFGGAGDDTIFGDAGNDVIFGDAGRDVINAGSGDDTAYASQGDGDDVLDGGEGANDTLDYSAIIANLTVNLGSSGVGSAASAQSGTDTLRGFEHVIGGAGNDTITASSAVNVLDGGAGNDTFVFTSATAANGDRIVGFETGDQIDLRPILSNLGINDDIANHFTTSGFNLAGQVRLRVDGNDTVIEGNTDTLDDVDFSITVVGRTNLNGTDFS
jgi:Ca2+-binding RTX toxin-like protein